MAFKVGQKVVCVNDSEKAFKRTAPGRIYIAVGGMDGLTKGKIYTIREIVSDEFDGQTCLLLAEIHRPPLGNETQECGFHPDRFRPLVSTNIDVFKAILANPHKQLETVE